VLEILMKRTLSVLVGCWMILAPDAAAQPEFPRMEFNDVREVAPGVFFRYSAISATDPTVVFGGSNNIWVVFEDYVVVIDANFPKEAADVVKAIRKTTDKPIRYVLDTHHHGDHAYGNAVWVKEGATIIGQKHCHRLLTTTGPKEFEKAGQGPTGRKDVAESVLKPPTLVFDDRLVLDDGKQRVEFLFLGHAHTSGDAVAYLPKHKLLCTGDACVNGAFNYMGHSDTASWIRVLERMEQLDIKMICPGHGQVTGKDLLGKQKRYFQELRQQVKKGIDDSKTLEDITRNIDMPWYKEWTGKDAKLNGDNVKHVYQELTGTITPVDLIDVIGLSDQGPSYGKDTPGWVKPRRIVIPNLSPSRLAELKLVAPEIEFVPARTAEEAAKLAADADGVVGFCSPAIVQESRKLRWVQVGSAGVENYLFPELVGSDLTLTSAQNVCGPEIADQVLAMLLGHARGLRKTLPVQLNESAWRKPAPGDLPQEWKGKTMLVVGLGGIGTTVARRGHASGLHVLAIDPGDLERPDFVFSLAKPDRLLNLLPMADVVVIASPLTPATRGMIGAEQFRAMKPSAFFINVARGGIVQTDALVEALEKKRIAGAGLDVVEPESLPDGHPLRKLPTVIIMPNGASQSPEGAERQWRLWRENVRRFAAGEPLLCVVDKARGN
jgi:phosphoglycerate dehydrogenase-like enzyme/glyoxylase-like metal-dependent hydrolase (beta-lactamase superfamily II)